MRFSAGIGALVAFFSFSSFALEKAPREVQDWINSKSAINKRLIVRLATDTPVNTLPSLPRNRLTHAKLIKMLKSSYKRAAATLRQDLKARGYEANQTTELWLIGAMSMDADPAMGLELLSNPKVQRIDFVKSIHLIEPVEKLSAEPKDHADAYTYGLQKIGVPDIRKKFPKMTGKGVRVGVLDTGIDDTHPDLKGKLDRFSDFIANEVTPYDDHGHGTHVSGTISGGNASGTYIGVAPDVRLIVGKVFTAQGSGSDEIILKAMQWMTDPDGNPDTESDVPHVVSNSWGGTDGQPSDQDSFYTAILAWQKLEIFPSFAAGNSGPGPKTIEAPGIYKVSFAVGATDDQDMIASFSSRGPGEMLIGGQLVTLNKPDVSAPGKKVYSSIPGGQYASWSGTSMATPHVTGAFAILRQAFPNASISELAKKLASTSQDLGSTGYDPNFGYGRIDLLKALTAGGRSRKIASR